MRRKEKIEYHRLRDSFKLQLQRELVYWMDAMIESHFRGAPLDFDKKVSSILERIIWENNIQFKDGQKEDFLQYFQPAIQELKNKMSSGRKAEG